MLTQAVTFAAAGAIYPVALAAIIAMLGGPEPVRRALAFLAGGAIASLVGFVAVVLLVATTDFTPGKHPTVAATIKVILGAGLLLLALRTILKRRGSGDSRPEPAAPPPSSEEATEASLRRAFVSGMVVYFPGLFLVASATAVANADAAFVPTALTILLCVAVLLLVIEIPIAAFVVARERVQPPMERLMAAVRAHSNQIVFVLEIVVGAYLLITGLRDL